MLNTLILTNRSPKYNPFSRILGCFLQSSIPQAQGLTSEKASFGVHAVKHDLETLPFLADKRVYWHTVVVKEDFVSIYRLPAHFPDLAKLKTWGFFVEIDKEQGEAF